MSKHVNMRIRAKYALEGWTVRPTTSMRLEQPYYLHKQVKVVLPNRNSVDPTYEATLREKDDGWVLIGYNGRAAYIRTIRPDDFVDVELDLDEAFALINRMKEDSEEAS